MSGEPENFQDWIAFFERSVIDADVPPFSFIRKAAWSHKCTYRILEPGEVLISPLTQKTPADCLYVIGKGHIGIGDYVREGNKFYCVEKANLRTGSILLEAEAPMEIAGKRYVGTIAQQTAWASSELLSRVMAYTYEDRTKDVKGRIKFSERKIFAEQVVLLKIPFECIQDFVNTEQLRTYMYEDAFHKSRQYWLLTREVDYEPGHKAAAAACLIESLWKHCFNNGLCVNGRAYMLSVDRTNAILGIPGGVNRKDAKIRSDNLIIDDAIPILKQDGFKLNKIKRDNLPDDLKRFYDYAYPGNEQGGKGSPYEIEVVSYNHERLLFT